MNFYTREIADYLEISMTEAEIIQDAMEIDFSSASMREFRDEAERAEAQMTEEQAQIAAQALRWDLY